jgi:hypothetical protein
MRTAARRDTLVAMNDGKLDALRRDPVFAPLRPPTLLEVARAVDLVDLRPGEVLSPADVPPAWGYYCLTGALHALVRGRPVPQVEAPALFLPQDLPGTALVAAAPTRAVAVGAAAFDWLLRTVPLLGTVPTYLPLASSRARVEVR